MNSPVTVQPLVSIVMTAFNAERFIVATVRAALAQDYPSFEVVVVDDGSTDRTATLCEAIADPRLRVIRTGKIGRCRALNVAVQHARGRFIANNDADDLSLPSRLSYTIGFLQSHPEVALVGTPAVPARTFQQTVPAELAGSAATPPDPGKIAWPSRLLLYRRNLFNHSTIAYPKEVWSRMGGYDEALDVCEDYDFYLRAVQFGRAALLPDPTVLWLTDSGGYFRRKSMQEYLQAMARIKRRSYHLLQLPLWMRPYHALWVQVYRVNILCRGWPNQGAP